MDAYADATVSVLKQFFSFWISDCGERRRVGVPHQILLFNIITLFSACIKRCEYYFSWKIHGKFKLLHVQCVFSISSFFSLRLLGDGVACFCINRNTQHFVMYTVQALDRISFHFYANCGIIIERGWLVFVCSEILFLVLQPFSIFYKLMIMMMKVVFHFIMFTYTILLMIMLLSLFFCHYSLYYLWKECFWIFCVSLLWFGFGMELTSTFVWECNNLTRTMLHSVHSTSCSSLG